MTRVLLSISSALVLLLILPAYGQRHQQSRGSAAPATGTAAPVEPDVERLERAVELQATEDQTRKFHGMTASTELAQRHARELQQQVASAPEDTVTLMHRATTLEDDVDRALTDYRIFRRSLADQQEIGLKKPMKKLITSVHAISKDADAMSQQLQQAPVNSTKVRSIAEHLEKELGALQSAQVNLGKEMSIQGQ